MIDPVASHPAPTTSPGLSRWVALAAFALLVWAGRDALPPFVVAGVLAYILTPLADTLAERAHIRRPFAAGLIFLAVVALLGFGVWLLETRLAAEVRLLVAEGPSITGTVVDRLTGGQPVSILGQELTPRELTARIDDALTSESAGLGNALHVATVAIQVALETLLALVILGYLLITRPRPGAFLQRFVPEERRADAARVAADVNATLGRYLRGQLILIALMSALTFVGLEWGFHLRYALPIAIATGFLEIIPLIGPVSAGAIACAVGFVQGGVPMAGALALFYFVLRQVEDHLVMPQIVGRAIHVHPVVTIFAVLVGERIGGALGMLLAVPFAAAVKVVLDYLYPTALTHRS